MELTSLKRMRDLLLNANLSMIDTEWIREIIDIEMDIIEKEREHINKVRKARRKQLRKADELSPQMSENMSDNTSP